MTEGMWIAIITGVLAAIPVIVLQLRASKETQKIHVLVNSRMDEFKHLLAKEAGANDKGNLKHEVEKKQPKK